MIFHNASHARGFYRSKNYLKPSEPLILANRQVLTVEFYLHFWEILGPLLLRVANQCFRDGNLCDSMKGSVTRLIYKRRGDIKSLKDWRPISLLNVDYKIISKVLTSRLAEVLEFIVNLLRDIIDFIQETDECAILVSLDQEKAFDTVDRSFLLFTGNLWFRT